MWRTQVSLRPLMMGLLLPLNVLRNILSNVPSSPFIVPPQVCSPTLWAVKVPPNSQGRAEGQGLDSRLRLRTELWGKRCRGSWLVQAGTSGTPAGDGVAGQRTMAEPVQLNSRIVHFLCHALLIQRAERQSQITRPCLHNSSQNFHPKMLWIEKNWKICIVKIWIYCKVQHTTCFALKQSLLCNSVFVLNNRCVNMLKYLCIIWHL